MTSITVSWPARVLSPNVSAHWRRVSDARKVAHAEAFALARQAGITAMEGPIRVRIDAYPKCERRRDYDNMLASLKAHLDGLASAMGVNDSEFRPELTIHPANCSGVVKITVEAI